MGTAATDILQRIDVNTCETLNYKKVTTWHDGTAMTDAKCDGVIYRKKDGYYKKALGFEYDARLFGVSKNSNDNTYNLNKAIQTISSLGGGVIKLTEDIVIKGSIKLNKNIRIEGLVGSNAKHTDALVKITHSPDISDTDLFYTTAQEVSSNYGYCGGVSIANLTIKGGAKSRRCFSLFKMANLVLERIYTDTFVDSLVLETSMNSQINLCNFAENTTACVRFVGSEQSTSTTFTDCYFHFSKWGVVAEHRTCVGVVFDKCIVESNTDGGYDIHTDNNITIISPYSENIPVASAADIPVIQVGVNGIEHNPGYPTATVSVLGGILAGCNFGIDYDSVIIKADKVQMLSFFGVTFQRANSLISTTQNTKMVNFESCPTFELASLYRRVYDKSKVLFNRMSVANAIYNQTETKSQRYKGIKDWGITNNQNYTEADLEVEIDGIKMFVLDSKKNVKINYDSPIYNLEKAVIIGISSPNLAGFSGPGLPIWVGLDVNGMPALKWRDSLGYEYTNGVLAVSTANRPIYNYVGKCVYDTDLKKPIFWDGGYFRDSSGVIV